MFDFNYLNFGYEIEAHGEKWISIKRLAQGCHLAIRPGALPAKIHFIQEKAGEENDEIKKGPGDSESL